MGTTTLGVLAANSRNNLPTAALLTGGVVRTTSTLTVVKEGDIFFFTLKNLDLIVLLEI